jgi:hypothetical protein
MGPLDLARKYMAILFEQGDLSELDQVLANTLYFSGPFYEFHTANAYIEALKSGPPRDFQYEMIAAYENDTTACLMYQFQKPGVSVPMAQYFEVKDDRISRILLVFDSAPFIQATPVS